MVALMARALTGGLSVAAWAAPRLPHALVVPLALRSRLVAAVDDEAVSMARAWTGCVCVVARVPPCPPPPALVVPLVAL